MRILHLSYVHIIDYNDPEEWLDKINFYTNIPVTMAENADVKSVHCINYTGKRFKGRAEFHFLKCSKFQMMFPFTLHNYVKKLNPDVIIVHGSNFPEHVLLLRWQLGNTVKIAIQHAAEIPRLYLRRYLQKLVDRFVHAYFFISFDHAKMWLNTKLIKDASKVHEVMEASSVFYPMFKDEARSKVRLDGQPIYLWVGRLNTNNDPITLVKAFITFLSFVPDAKLYMVFKGDELLAEIENLLNEHPALKNRILLVGTVAHHNLQYWFNGADVILSTSHYEGSGIAVSEGMSCGCIPILSDIDSFRMMTNQGQCGLLFKPGDVNSLEAALRRSSQLVILQERNKVLDQFNNNLSFNAIASKMLSVAEKLVK